MRPGSTLPRQASNRHSLRESGAITLDIEVRKGIPMAAATLKNQLTIIANQKKMLLNQSGLKAVLANQSRILRNQDAIIKNQRKILANHARILAQELTPTGRR